MRVPDDPPLTQEREFFRTGPQGIRDQLQHLIVRQKDYEKHLARQLGTDETGLHTMFHLIATRTSSPTVLARSVGISTAAMTLVLDRLEAAGHVRRTPHPTDRRKVNVTASHASAAQADALLAPLLTTLDEMIQTLGQDEHAVIQAFLHKTTELYRVVTPGEREDSTPPE